MSLSKNSYEYIKNTLLHSERTLTNTKLISHWLWGLALVFILELTLIYTKGPNPTSCLVGLAQHSGPRTNLVYRPMNSVAHIGSMDQYISAQDHSKPKPQIRAQQSPSWFSAFCYFLSIFEWLADYGITSSLHGSFINLPWVTISPFITWK